MLSKIIRLIWHLLVVTRLCSKLCSVVAWLFYIKTIQIGRVLE